jgi:hypothetical protein
MSPQGHPMLYNQLDSLKRDYVELQYFLRRLEKEGDTKKIQIFQEKSKYLVASINRMEETTVKN